MHAGAAAATAPRLIWVLCIRPTTPTAPQHERIRLGSNWGAAAAFFLMWDVALLALAWWALKRFAAPGVRQYKVHVCAHCCLPSPAAVGYGGSACLEN